MSSKVVVILILLVQRGSCDTGGNNTPTSNNYHSSEVWFRNLDSQLLRLGSRLDQLLIRIDHLDSRVGRVQSQAHLRFDNIETSMQTTRQRLDSWSNQLNNVEEQLARKWKSMEARFESLVNSIDTKLDSKFNLIQRDNRRHNEFISSSFNSVIISQEKLNERVLHSISQINASVSTTQVLVENSTGNCTVLLSTYDKVLSRLDSYGNVTRTCEQQNERPLELPTNNASNLITAKVNNMFDELLKRSYNVETALKDSFTMSNMTRREVQDGFRALIPIANHISQVTTRNSGRAVSSLNSAGSSTEVMSMVVEALASVESMSTALGRRMSELSRSLDERFEMVSMTLNGFLESCLRIQERTPLYEEHISYVLGRILDTVDNSTRNATTTWVSMQEQLLEERNRNATCTGAHVLEHLIALLHQRQVKTVEEEDDDDSGERLKPLSRVEATNTSHHLSEEEKKSLWDNWLSKVPESS